MVTNEDERMTGRDLKALKKTLGLTGGDLSEMVGRSARWVRRYLSSDDRLLPVDVTRRLRQVLAEKEAAGEFVPQEQLMGVGETLKALGLTSKTTLDRWERSGTLTPVGAVPRERGRKYLREDVMALKAKRNALERERSGTLSTMEVVNGYDIPKKTLYLWVEQGSLSAWRDSENKLRFDPDEVMALKEKQKELERDLAGTLSTMEVVNTYGIPRKTLYSLMRQGWLPERRDFENNYRFDPDEVEQYLA